MIGVKIEYEGNTLLMSLPTDELHDHLGSIGIKKISQSAAQRIST